MSRVPGPKTAAFNFMDDWQKNDDWLCPWRITRIDSSDGMVYGYPCGEPKKAFLKVVK